MKKKYGELYYQVVKSENGFKYLIYGNYFDKEPMEQSDEDFSTKEEAEISAEEAISYHYD